jgi:hypothetical protein
MMSNVKIKTLTIGCRASHGCFCPGEPFNSGDGDGYSNKEILILKIITAVLFVLAM